MTTQSTTLEDARVTLAAIRSLKASGTYPDSTTKYRSRTLRALFSILAFDVDQLLTVIASHEKTIALLGEAVEQGLAAEQDLAGDLAKARTELALFHEALAAETAAGKPNTGGKHRAATFSLAK